MIRFLKPKDKSNFLYFCKNFHPDFHIIREGKKKYLTDSKIASKVFNICQKHNGKCIVSDNNGEINGIALILDNSCSSQSSFKILTDNPKTMQNIIQFMVWHITKEFVATFNKRNYLYRLCKERRFQYNERKQNGFKFLKDNKHEISFRYIPNRLNKTKSNFKGKE